MKDFGQLYRAYYGCVYRMTEAITRPGVDALSGVFQDAFTKAIREGVKDALNPADLIGDFLRKKN